jgi:hypothetical protein
MLYPEYVFIMELNIAPLSEKQSAMIVSARNTASPSATDIQLDVLLLLMQAVSLLIFLET